MTDTLITSPVTKVNTTADSVTGEKLIEPSKTFESGGEHTNVIPWEHAYLHKGSRWIMSQINIALADDAYITVMIDVGSTYDLHMFAKVNAGGDTTLEIFEAPTAMSVGTALTAFNLNRHETAVSSGTFVHTPTGDPTTGSTELLNGGLLIAGGTGGNAGGGGGEGRDEFILKTDTRYVYRVRNIGGGAKAVSVSLDFYEHEPITGVA